MLFEAVREPQSAEMLAGRAEFQFQTTDVHLSSQIRSTPQSLLQSGEVI
jgi:hypothetical protein